jgi:phage tail-like protein
MAERALANGHAPPPSRYLRYLPAIYHQDPFMGQFLRVFEDILFPIQVMVNGLPHQFDPRIATPTMVERVAGWVGADDIAQLPYDRWRELVLRAVWLHRWRGTKRALREAFDLALGIAPLILEYTDGAALADDSRLGMTTALAERHPLRLTILFDCAPDLIDMHVIEHIIDRYTPADVTYSVSFIEGTTSEG